MQTIKLGALGTIDPQIPSSLASIFDIISAWSDKPSQTELGRICAAAICLSISSPGAPKYNPVKDNILGYGVSCLDYLLGSNVSIADIYSQGAYLMSQMINKLPNGEEVEETADFLSQPEAAASSD